MTDIIISNYNQNSASKAYGYIYRAISPYGKIYIGQTTKELRKYIRTHYFSQSRLNKKGAANNRYFIRALKKYGPQNFKWTCICECYSKNDLNLTENYFIMNFYESTNKTKGYNLREGGDSGGKLSHTTKQKLSEAVKKHFSDELNKKKMSEAIKNFYKNPDNVKKQSETMKNYYKNNPHKYKNQVLAMKLANDKRKENYQISKKSRSPA